MVTTPKIGVLLRQAADRRLIQRFLSDLGLSYVARPSFSTEDVESKDWQGVGLLIVDETNAGEHGEGLLSLKEHDLAAYLPILVLVPAAEPAAEWLARGFDDVIRTPITQSEFGARLMVFLRLREASEQRFQTLFETTPIGIFRASPDGGLQMANPALLKLLGFESLSRKHFAEGVAWIAKA
jgi:PAS domain-containing protein